MAELEGLGVVHACWDDWSIDSLIKSKYGPRMTQDLLVKASNPRLPEHRAIETLLKGYEVSLPANISFMDKDGNCRNAVRVQWWKQNPTSLGDIALPVGVDIGSASSLPPPDEMPKYDLTAKPCFIGHYWLNGDPSPLSDNVACLDYSVAKQGRLVAYRWCGESSLTSDNFTFSGEG